MSDIKLQALVDTWRQQADDRQRYSEVEADTLEQCADELEAIINGSESGIEAAFQKLKADE